MSKNILAQFKIEAKFLEAGILKSYEKWNNIYLKFSYFDENQNIKEIWLYFSEHVHKPYMYQQIPMFLGAEPKIKPGDKMDVFYCMKQSANQTTKLLIERIENHRPQ